MSVDSALREQKRLRILMVAACPFPWPRGTPVRILRLAEALSELGHHVDVMTYHLGDRSEPLPFSVTRIPNVRFYKKVSAGPSLTKLLLLDPLLAQVIRRQCKKQTYDIIHAHHIEGFLAASTARMLGVKLPIVYDAHTLVGDELPDYGPDFGCALKKMIGRLFDTRLPKKASGVIAVTPSIQEHFLTNVGLPAAHVRVIPNGVEDEYIKRAEEARGSCSRKPVTSGARFLFAGNMASYQGVERMLRAFGLAAARLPDSTLTIVTGEDFSPYRQLAGRLGIDGRIVIRHAKLSELPATISEADVLLNPRTHCSGIPQKLLNYMVSGRPIVSFNGSAKIVEHEVHALVVEDEDVEGFADAMVRLAQDQSLRERLGRASIALIKQRYSWRRAALESVSFYQRLA